MKMCNKFTRKCKYNVCLQTFQSDMISRQQILHSILREGQQMLVDGDVENREQFEKKLKLLQEQWNKVVKRSQEKKGEIDRLVAQWLIYKNQKDRLQVGNFSFKIRKLKFQLIWKNSL